MAKTEKPNILVIWGDDIGISNLSCYSHTASWATGRPTSTASPGKA
jgi:arylsulfatase A-like enzyme